jgi:hypothetical protein
MQRPQGDPGWLSWKDGCSALREFMVIRERLSLKHNEVCAQIEALGTGDATKTGRADLRVVEKNIYSRLCSVRESISNETKVSHTFPSFSF